VTVRCYAVASKTSLLWRPPPTSTTSLTVGLADHALPLGWVAGTVNVIAESLQVLATMGYASSRSWLPPWTAPSDAPLTDPASPPVADGGAGGGYSTGVTTETSFFATYPPWLRPISTRSEESMSGRSTCAGWARIWWNRVARKIPTAMNVKPVIWIFA